MKKDLPSVYAQKVDHDTNRSVEYTKSEDKPLNRSSQTEKTIEQKILEIFNHVGYVYKIDVVIETKDKTETKQLVGRNKDYLITMENEQIPIASIKDIYIK